MFILVYRGKDHPQVHGFISVSVPVYDEKSGLVLIYKGTQSHWLAGGGSLILYKYETGTLKELSHVGLWIS